MSDELSGTPQQKKQGKKAKYGKHAAKIARCQANAQQKKNRKRQQLEARREKARKKNKAKRDRGELGGKGRTYHQKKVNPIVLGGLNNPYPEV